VSHSVSALGDEWHRTQSADMMVEGKKIGTIGTLMPFIMKQLGIASGVAIAVLDVELLRESVRREKTFVPLPKFPFAARDISLVFAGRQKSQAVVELMREVGEPLLRKAELFDVFERDGKRNLAFHLSFGADERTLTSQEIDRAFDRIVAAVKERLGGELHQ
jgi:phenylalanyl-tRNA synthetase beta chain